MGYNRIEDEREGEYEQGGEAKNAHDEETNENVKEVSFLKLHEPSIHGDTLNDRPDNESDIQYRDRPEATQEDTQTNGKDEQTISKDIQKLVNKIQGILPNWQQFISNLGDPRNWFLTKEDFELVKAYFSELDANIISNVMEYLRNASNDQCAIHKAIQFLVIRKIGTIQLQSIKQKYDTLLEMLKQQTSMYTTALQQLGVLAQSFSQAHAPPPGSLPNILYDIKLDALIATIIASLTAVGIEIGNIKNNIRTIININEFCIRPCRTDCTDTWTPISTLSMGKIANEHMDKMYNEGVEFAEESERVLRMLEELMELELEYAKLNILKRKNNSKNGGNNTHE